MGEDIEQARVTTDLEEAHPTLFPVAKYSRAPLSPQDACNRTRLNWLTAVRLHQDGWLSFDPKNVKTLSLPQETELVFLGTLVATGCDETLLGRLLAGLRKPYAYRIDRLYYDWQEQRWQLRPTDEAIKQGFKDWLEDLVDAGRGDLLESLRDSVAGAISELRRMRP